MQSYCNSHIEYPARHRGAIPPRPKPPDTLSTRRIPSFRRTSTKGIPIVDTAITVVIEANNAPRSADRKVETNTPCERPFRAPHIATSRRPPSRPLS